MCYRVPEGFGGLAGKGPTGGIGDGAGNHDRQGDATVLKVLLRGVDRRLGVQGVEYGFDQDEVATTLGQSFDSFIIVVDQGLKIDVPVARVVHVR